MIGGRGLVWSFLFVFATLAVAESGAGSNRQCIESLLGVLQPPAVYMGIIFATEGTASGNNEVYIHINHHHPRTDDARSYLDLIKAEVAKIPQKAILYLNTHDNDAYDIISRSGNPVEGERRFQALFEACPHVYFLAWNPTLYNASRGNVFPRTIPVPDFEILRDGDFEAVPFEQRGAGIAWRGVSTGTWVGGKYEPSDRYRAVELMQSMPNSNVKFSGLVQGVGGIPQHMMGSGMNRGEMAARKAIMDVDGNANAWQGLRWKLRSGVAVVKFASSRNFVQWYYPLLQDGVHLALIKSYDDKAKAAVKALLEDDSRLQSLGRHGREFALKYLSQDAAKAYLAEIIPNIHTVAKEMELADWRIDGQPPRLRAFGYVDTPEPETTEAPTQVPLITTSEPPAQVPSPLAETAGRLPSRAEQASEDDGGYRWLLFVVVAAVCLECFRRKRKVRR